MALTDTALAHEDVPLDTFRIRIAIVRADKGWNYTQAERETGIKAENWRLWEKTERHPQNYEEVCQQIADGAGYNRQWLMAGGPLRSRCSSPLTLVNGGVADDAPVQRELHFGEIDLRVVRD